MLAGQLLPRHLSRAPLCTSLPLFPGPGLVHGRRPRRPPRTGSANNTNSMHGTCAQTLPCDCPVHDHSSNTHARPVPSCPSPPPSAAPSWGGWCGGGDRGTPLPPRFARQKPPVPTATTPPPSRPSCLLQGLWRTQWRAAGPHVVPPCMHSYWGRKRYHRSMVCCGQAPASELAAARPPRPPFSSGAPHPASRMGAPWPPHLVSARARRPTHTHPPPHMRQCSSRY